MTINLHHWHWHLIYPFDVSDCRIVDKERYGELFYYMHQQMIARHNMKRFSNNLARVTRFNNFRDPIAEGYFPTMNSLAASRALPARFDNIHLKDLNRELYQINLDLKDLDRWRDRMFEAIHQGFVIDSNGNRIELDEQRGIDILGNMMEASIISPKQTVYGDFHIMYRIFISSFYDPVHRQLEYRAVMTNLVTAMSDPVFYRWHAYIDDIFQEHKTDLPAYNLPQLQNDGISIAGVQISAEGGQPNVLTTFWQQSDVDLSRGMDFSPRGNVFAPFTYTINVNNDGGAQRFGTVRIFMAPKTDERGQPMLLRDQRLMMIELDKFIVSLNPGQNTIRRRSTESSVTIPIKRTFHNFDQNRSAERSAEELEFNFCGCGWPNHMVIAMGLSEGFRCELFIMVSNYEDDRVDQDLVGACSDAASYCGVRDRLYPDRRPMGYPFDRLPRLGVERLAEFLTPNMSIIDVVIRHDAAGSLNLCVATTNTELDAKTFAAKASERFYNLYDKFAAESYDSTDNEDFETIFAKVNTIKTITQELVQISEEASAYDLTQIQDPDLKRALNNLREVGSLYVLGDDYFESFVINLNSLRSLATDKDIEPYLGGANMPYQDDSSIGYYPEIQKIYEKSNDPSELKYYWEAWREKNAVWASVNFYTIIEGMQKAAKLLHRPILEIYYSYYEVKEFLGEMDKVMQELKPAYQQLHAFIRNELHKKYGSDVVDPNGPIPDHLFQQVLAQDWKEGSVIESYFPFKDLPPYDAFVKKFSSKQVLDEAHGFYKSLGFADLDEDFVKNRLSEQEETENNGECHANIFDITPKTYMKYCQMVDFKKFMQMQGYITHIHYAQQTKNLPAYFFDSYDLKYPVGEAVILSACTPKHLQTIGLAADFKFNDLTLMNRLSRMAIHTIMNIPVYYVHSKVINELLNGTIEMEDANKRYWHLMQEFAGVEPPSDREEGAIDFPYKFYMDLEQNHQTRKFVSEILGYQFYRAFCKKSNQSGPLHNCDFYGNKEVGNDLKSMMSLGSSKSWHDVISKILGEKTSLSADSLLEYYAPIIDWVNGLNKQSKVKIGWNESKKKVL